MGKDLRFASDIALFLAGVLAARYITRDRESAGSTAPSSASTAEPAPERALRELEKRLADLEAVNGKRFSALETRLEEHAAKLAELPSTQQIVGAIEKLLAKTTTSLQEQVSAQAQSIEGLRTAVSQTDAMLERVLHFTRETLAGRPNPETPAAKA